MPSGNTGPNVSKKESVKEMPFYVDKIAAFKAFFAIFQKIALPLI